MGIIVATLKAAKLEMNMKTVYLIRHAKSSWADISASDFDRNLNERGEKDAPKMAVHLRNKIKSPDVFISSPAKRAKKTCKIFAKEFDYNTNKIIYLDDLYLASQPQILKTILSIDDKYLSVAIFGHNPGITETANSMVENVSIDNIPTCGVFAVEADCKYWQDFEKCKRTLLFFDYPRII